MWPVVSICVLLFLYDRDTRRISDLLFRAYASDFLVDSRRPGHGEIVAVSSDTMIPPGWVAALYDRGLRGVLLFKKASEVAKRVENTPLPERLSPAALEHFRAEMLR